MTPGVFIHFHLSCGRSINEITCRALRSWANPDSVVAITSNQPDEIVIRPHKKYDWDKIWKLIKRSRAIKGNGRGSAAQFIEKDRQSH